MADLQVYIKEYNDTVWTDITTRVVKADFKLRSGFSGLGGSINFSKLDITYRASDLAVAAIFHSTAKQIRIKRNGNIIWEGYTEGNSAVSSTAVSSLAWVKITAYPYLHALEGLKATEDEVYYNVYMSQPLQTSSSLLHILWNKMVAKCSSPYKEALQNSYTITFPTIAVQRSIAVFEEGTEYLKTFLEILKQYAYTVTLDGFAIKFLQPYADDTRTIGEIAFTDVQQNPTIKTAPYIVSSQPVVTLTRIKTVSDCLLYSLAESDTENAEEELYIGASHPAEGDYEEISYRNDSIENDTCKLIYANTPDMTYEARYSDNSGDAILRVDVLELGSTSGKIKLTNTSTTLSCYLNQLWVKAKTAYFADTSLQVTTASIDSAEKQEETTEWLSDEANARIYCNALKSEQKASTASLSFKSDKLGTTYKPNDLITVGNIGAVYIIKQIDENMTTGEKEYTCGIFKLVADTSKLWSKDGTSTVKKGEKGVGISSITEYYAVSSSNTTAPTTWQTTVPEMTEKDKYLWNYEKISYTNNTTTETLKRVIGVYGDDGTSFSVVVISSNGNTFRMSENVETTLSVQVLKNNEDITDTLENSRFKWTRKTGNDTADEQWNTSSKALYHKSVDITTEDCIGRTVFECEVDLDNLNL